MAEKIGKVECKTIARLPRNKVLIHFSLYNYSFEKKQYSGRTTYSNENMTYQKKEYRTN
jgi:hypothetical protein